MLSSVFKYKPEKTYYLVGYIYNDESNNYT